MARDAGRTGQLGHADAAPVFFVGRVGRLSDAQALDGPAGQARAGQRDLKAAGAAAADGDRIVAQQEVQAQSQGGGKLGIAQTSRCNRLAAAVIGEHIGALAEQGLAVEVGAGGAEPIAGGRLLAPRPTRADAALRLGLAPADQHLRLDP